MTLAQEQYRPRFGPAGVPQHEFVEQVRQQVLRPWQKYPRDRAYLLAGNTSSSLARARRRGDRPLPIRVYVGWLMRSEQDDRSDIGRASLQQLAELIDCDVTPRVSVSHRSAAQEIADVSRTTGEALAVFADAMDDAELDKGDAEILLASLLCVRDELDEAIAALREVVE